MRTKVREARSPNGFALYANPDNPLDRNDREEVHIRIAKALTQAHSRSMRRLSEWGDAVIHPREWLLAEAEELEHRLATRLLTELTTYFDGEEVLTKDKPS